MQIATFLGSVASLSCRVQASSKTGVPNISLTMHPFSMSTDELVTLKVLMTKYFNMANRYIKQ